MCLKYKIYILLIVILISNVYNIKKYTLFKVNNFNIKFFFLNNIKYKKNYKLKAKEFINYKEIQLKRIDEYRKRCGTDKNNINYNPKDKYDFNENLLFVRNEVLPTLAKIDKEKTKEREKYNKLFMNINDYNCNFNRQSFLQFLIDLYNIFLKIDEIFLMNKDFSLLTYIGPMELTTYLYKDIIYLSSIIDSENITISEYAKEYISHLEELNEQNKFKFLGHAYLFYKSFHLSKDHLLNCICKYLNIIKTLKSSMYTSDVKNFEYCINKMSRNWNRWQKDTFLSSLYDATDKMMILTKHFQKIKN